MDKNEYRAKLDEINDLVDRQDYKGALKIVDTIDWRRVRSARTLCMVGEIYEANKRYDDSRKLLLLAHQRAPIGKTVLYRLVELSIKMGNFDEAVEYYKQFVEISPNDNSRYILKYKIYRAKRSSMDEQISILQEYKSREYTERWAYELARLYAKAGMKEACVEECDDLILWFSEGKYVTKAMELKMKYQPLTASQQEKYDKRFTNRPSASVAAAASAVTAASQAAAKVVEKAGTSAAGFTESQDKEIEDILNSIVIGGDTVQVPVEEIKEQLQKEAEETPAYTPQMENPEELQGKVAQGIRDVFQGKNTASADDEAAAALDPSEGISPEEKGYVVKDLEPEELQKTPGFKPFHVGGAMTMEVKAEAPQSKMLKAEDFNTDAFKTDIKEREIDLEALLAETANELAQAVAEETKGETKETTEDVEAETTAETEPAEPEAVKEAETTETTETEETAAEAIKEEAEEVSAEQVIPAPAAARAAIVAENLSAALAAKAEAFDALAAGDTAEKVEETVVEDIVEEPSQTDAEEPVTEETAAEEPSEAAEEESTEESSEEVVEEVLEETPEEMVEGIPEGATREFPVEELKRAQKEMSFQEALEKELSKSALSDSENSHMKRVTASVESEPAHSSMPFNTAVEGLMRHHLTPEEHRRLFTYFAPIPGMTQQISEALDTAQESACSRTSRSGNIIVTGREGSGKTRLSEGLIKALCKERQMEGAKIAYITAEQLNQKDPVAVVGKLAGGFLVVENAGKLNPEIVENMSKAMEFKTNRLTVILEDLRPGIHMLKEKYPEFMEKFDSSIAIPVFTNDELVSFAKTYAKELGYKIDDMAVLALYTLIGDNQNEENPVAIGTVREMMDEAIKKASRKGRRAGKKVGKRHLDESGRIMLYEKDFDV